MAMSSIQISAVIAGLNIAGTITRTPPGSQGHEVPLPAAKAGAVVTKTDANTCTCQMAAGHGFADNDVVDLHWDGGCRYGMVAMVDDVDVNEVVFDGGAGDDCPVAETAITAAEQITVDVQLSGDSVDLVAVKSDVIAHVDFETSAPASIFAQSLAVNAPWIWAADVGVTNPFAGESIAQAKVSNGATTAGTLLIGFAYDSDG